MSLRLNVYYSVLLGAWAAFVAWALARLFAPAEGVGELVAQHLLLGGLVGAGLGALEAWAHLPGGLTVETASRGGTGLVIGMFAGLLAALVSHVLARASATPFLLIPGWMLLGGLLGAAGGVYDFAARFFRGSDLSGVLRRLWMGLAGGALGGLIGGALAAALVAGLSGPLTPASGYPPERPLFSHAAGMVVVGAAIGLFPAWLHWLFKEAWVRLESGSARGSELILTRMQTMIGRGRGCDLVIDDDDTVELRHAQIVRWGSTYLLADVNSRSGTYLNERRITEPTLLRSSDRIRVGASVILFRERRPPTARIAEEDV